MVRKNITEKDELTMEMPTNWAVTSLDKIADILRGVSYKKADAVADPTKEYVPILRANNIQEAGLVLENDLVFVPSQYVRHFQLLKTNDIVICMSSGSKHLVGKAAQLKGEWYGSFGAFCATVRVTENLDARYIGYLFQSEEYRNFISQRSLGVNINNLRRADVENIRVPLAPLNEQRRIVEAIETQFTRLDAGVEALKRLQSQPQTL